MRSAESLSAPARKGSQVDGDVIGLAPSSEQTLGRCLSLRSGGTAGANRGVAGQGFALFVAIADRDFAILMNRSEMVDRALAQNSSEPWDIIVIGGGATGVGVALDAAGRGYRTLLLEQHDFGGRSVIYT